jgi:hypothetical protein
MSTNCTYDVDCIGRRVCARNNTCSCISNGYVGTDCTTSHPSLILDSIVLVFVILLMIAMTIQLAIDLIRFWKFRLYIPHVSSSFFTTVMLISSTLCGILWICLDMFCTFDLSPPIVIYDYYKACPAALGSSVCFSLCIMFGYASLLNVMTDWFGFMTSVIGGKKEGTWKERIPVYNRIIHLSQSVFSFGLLVFLVSLRFDLLVIWMIPFTVGIIIVYCILGNALVNILLDAQSTIAKGPPTSPDKGGSRSLGGSDQQQQQQQPLLGRQLTSPIDGSSSFNNNNNNNNNGGNMITNSNIPELGRQFTSPGDVMNSNNNNTQSSSPTPLLDRQLTSPADALLFSNNNIQMGHQLTSPQDVGTNNNNNNNASFTINSFSESKSSTNGMIVGTVMARQMTFHTDVQTSSNDDGGVGTGSITSSPQQRTNRKQQQQQKIQGNQVGNLLAGGGGGGGGGGHATTNTNNTRKRNHRIVQINNNSIDHSSPGNSEASNSNNAMSVLLRTTMIRIRRTSLLVSVWIFLGIAFAVCAYLLIFPHTSFQYERGGWQRPGYWFFRASMVSITFVSLSVMWYVHSNNQLFITRLLQSIKQARGLNDAGVKEELRLDSFIPSGDGTTLGRAEGSTVIVINTVEVENTSVDNQLLQLWNNSQQRNPNNNLDGAGGGGSITYIEESVA